MIVFLPHKFIDFTSETIDTITEMTLPGLLEQRFYNGALCVSDQLMVGLFCDIGHIRFVETIDAFSGTWSTFFCFFGHLTSAI